MLSLYEILKASKTGIAPDMWTALAGANFGGAGSGAEVKELTGIPPLSFTANGTPLLDFLISGNMSQASGVSPTTPIQPSECGERTGQLIDYTQSESGGIDGSGNYVPANNLWRSTAYTPIDETLQYFVSWIANTNLNAVRINYYTSDKTHISREQINTSGTALTIPQNAAYFKWTLYAKTDVIIDLSCVQSLQLMINTGSTPLPYEPYGYKIPISSNSTTTPVYLGEVQTTRKIKKYEFTGQETGWNYSTNGGRTRAYIALSDSLGASLCICSHYDYVSSTIFYPDIDKFTLNSSGSLLIGLDSTIYADVNAFKTYLAQQYAAGTPVCVWYVLAESTTGIVNEPLRKIGNYADTVSYEQAGVQIPTNRGNTVIDVLTELKPSEMYIKYQK